MGNNINTIKRLSRKFQGIYILSPYNPDYLLVKNSIESTGVTLTSTQNTAGNTLVNQLQSYNLWTKLKAIYGILGGTAGAHKWNWKDPRDLNSAYRLTFSTGWTHASTGMTPNGTSAVIDTNLNENSILSLNNEHISIYSRTNSDGLYCDIGVGLGSDESTLFSKYTNIFYPRIQNTNTGIANTISSLGHFISNRINSTQVRAFQNGNIKLITNNSSAKVSGTFFIAAMNRLTVIPPGNVAYYSNRQYAFASIGDGLTDTEAANFYTAVQNYQTTLGRQV